MSCLHVCVPCACLIPVEAREAHPIPGSDRQLGAALGQLGIEPGSSKKKNKKNSLYRLSHVSRPFCLFFSMYLNFICTLAHLNVVSRGESLKDEKEVVHDCSHTGVSDGEAVQWLLMRRKQRLS